MEHRMRNPLPTRDDQCDKHGTFSSLNFASTRWSGCPTCATEAEAERKAQADAAERLDRRNSMMRQSGLEGRFMGCTFDNYEASSPEQKKVLDACKQYAAKCSSKNGGSGGLWLIGPPGTGKTHLGSAMVRYIIEERDADAAIYSGREMIRMLRATWGHKGAARDALGRAMSETEVINDLASMGLLVIDEIGIGFGTDSEHVQLFDIIDLRYKYSRPTVLLSNLPTKALKEAVGDRAYDRLREGAQVLTCQWDSHRGKPIQPRQSLEVVR